MRKLTTKQFKLSAFQFIHMIFLLLDSWPANILAGLNFRAQENRLMSPDGVCTIIAGLAGHKNKLCAALL